MPIFNQNKNKIKGENKMTKNELRRKIDKAGEIDTKIKEMNAELKELKEEIKDEAFIQKAAKLDGKEFKAVFTKNTKTTFKKSPESIYDDLKVKKDIIQIAALNVALAKKYFSKKEFEKITTEEVDTHGRVSFKTI